MGGINFRACSYVQDHRAQEASMAKPSKKRGRSGIHPGGVSWNDRRRQFQGRGCGRVVFNRAMLFSKRRKI